MLSWLELDPVAAWRDRDGRRQALARLTFDIPSSVASRVIGTDHTFRVQSPTHLDWQSLQRLARGPQ